MSSAVWSSKGWADRSGGWGGGGGGNTNLFSCAVTAIQRSSVLQIRRGNLYEMINDTVVDDATVVGDGEHSLNRCLYWC